jgi:hypothetical protein
MASNYRMLYGAAVTQLANSAEGPGRTAVQNEAAALHLKLFGPQPAPPPPRAGDFVRE